MKEDLEMLNIALDSKQQELELVSLLSICIILRVLTVDKEEVLGSRDRGLNAARSH